MEEQTLYENNQMDLIREFYRKTKNNELVNGNPDLFNNKDNKRYTEFISQVVNANPKEYTKKDFNKFKDTYKLAAYIIFIIFNDHNIINEVNEFFSHRQISDRETIIDGCCLVYKNLENNTLESIIDLPNDDNLSSIITMVHEFIHFHIFKHNISLEKKFYYEEILSIYAEKVAAKFIAEMNFQKDFERKIEQTRLECIKWHYIDRIEEENMVKALYQRAKTNHNFNLMDKLFIQEAEKNLPWLKNPEDTIAHDLYQKALAESYGFGYIYGEALSYYDSIDPMTTKNKVKETLNGRITIQNLLNYYDISMNKKTIEIAKEKVNKMS